MPSSLLQVETTSALFHLHYNLSRGVEPWLGGREEAFQTCISFLAPSCREREDSTSILAAGQQQVQAQALASKGLNGQE